MLKNKTMLIIGVAGFIGSHLADRLLAQNYSVIGVDNFVRGTRENIAHLANNSAFTFVEVDVSNYEKLAEQVKPILSKNHVDTVWHMAANSDIQSGVAEPNLDLRDTFMTTFSILRLMEVCAIKKIAFASTSAIYGETDKLIGEDYGPLFPISNYGAMKLASEASISSFLEKCLENAWIFRFPNVVGSRATHGIIYDLFNKLKKNSQKLEVLGDGSQRKPYLHANDLLDAMLYIWQNSNARLNYYNIGQPNSSTTVDYIAKAVVDRSHTGAKIHYTGGSKGWVGDVAKFDYDVAKLTNLGWQPSFNSKQSIDLAIDEMAQELGF